MPSPIVLDLRVRRSLHTSSPNSQSETKGYFLEFHCENIDLIKLIFNHSTSTTHKEEYTIFHHKTLSFALLGEFTYLISWWGQISWERTCVIIEKQSLLKKFKTTFFYAIILSHSFQKKKFVALTFMLQFCHNFNVRNYK